MFYVVNTAWIFRGCEPIWRNCLQCDYPPSGEQPINSWSEGSGVNINSNPAQIPEEKNTNVRVVFIDKQFETLLSSRSNSPHSESGFTTLFLSTRGEPKSSHPSPLSVCLSRSGSLGNGSLPAAVSWIRPATGPLDVPATGLENFPPFSFSPSISFVCLYRLFHPTPKFLKPKNIHRTH